jgi:hypothetical protein
MPFSLRFPIIETEHWASQYAYEDNVPILRIVKKVQERGFYMQKEFLALAKWKAARNIRRCEKNAPEEIECATHLALSAENRFEPLRIGILYCLEGVGWPMASVLLHFGHKDPYPILDFRVLWSPGPAEDPSVYNFKFWWDYVQFCRNLLEEAGTTIRNLDHALWQYSKERQP